MTEVLCLDSFSGYEVDETFDAGGSTCRVPGEEYYFSYCFT
jgi:hypothetical protein